MREVVLLSFETSSAVFMRGIRAPSRYLSENIGERRTLGSAGRWPVVRGSLPRMSSQRGKDVTHNQICALGKVHSARRPNAAGWQPALPRIPSGYVCVAGRAVSG
jgi:hypothetical protein